MRELREGGREGGREGEGGRGREDLWRKGVREGRERGREEPCRVDGNPHVTLFVCLHRPCVVAMATG